MTTRRPLTEKQKAALAKGRGKAGTKKATAAASASRRREQELVDSADPDAVLLEMQVQAGIAATRGLKRFNAGGEPTKLLIDVVREARQLSIEARQILIERGNANTADAFLDKVAARMSSCAEIDVKPVSTDA